FAAMSWEFNIPVCVADLVKPGGMGQYVVQDVQMPKDLPSCLKSFKAAMRSQGPLCILEHFDTVYMIRGFSVALPSLLLSGSLSAVDRRHHLNAVKMGVFLLCKLTESLESDSYRQSIVTAPGKGSKKSKSGSEGMVQWDSERYTVLLSLTQLLQLDIRPLWSLSLVEEEFVSCVTCCCYKLLENPHISHVKSKPARDSIIHLLGVMIKKYNHMLGARVKVIQLLQHFEQLAGVCAQAVASWSSEFGIKAIVGEIMREIGQKSSEELSREGSGVRAFSGFLSELSTLVPDVMIPNVSVLLTHLEGESPSMRVAVCEVLGEVLVRVLSGDKLEDSARADRDRFLDTLQEHIHDTHSHVRARVLQVYTRIVNSKALPLCRYTEVMELAVGRLGDKSVNVCKSAIQLLAAFIAHNPYSCKLSSADLRKPLDKEMAKLKEMKDKVKEKTPGEPPCNVAVPLTETQVEEHPPTSTQIQMEDILDDGELKKQEMLVQYLKDTESFALQVERTISIINNLLYWKTTTVVQEAVQFCVTVCEFSVADSLSGVRKMLPLVWSADTSVKESVLHAYKRLYLNPQGDSTRAKAQTLVDSLSALMVDASLGTIQCLEEIVKFFGCDGVLQSSVVQVLWERFSGKRETSNLHRRAAVLLLGMAARAEREVILSNLDTLCSVALEENVTEDYLLARDTVLSICNITDHVRQSKASPFRLPMDHQLFSYIYLWSPVLGVILTDPQWQSFMEQAVRLIYFLSESPDVLCSHLLQRSTRLLLEQINENREKNKVQVAETNQSQDPTQDLEQSEQGELLLSLCGCVAFWQVSYLERSVSTELRRRRGEREQKEEAKGPESSNDSCMEEELGLTGASAEDTEAELIRKICETELLSGEVFVPVLVKVCSSPGHYPHPQLTTAACLALSQYMMISPGMCMDHIRLLFTVLERSPLPIVRANAIIALGDLTVRFPNILEPWTPNLYARLSDDDSSVRLTAVTVLTQLVLKDVLKVKGQVSEVAVLLLDPEPHIASLALNFFNELAAKDNAIYNLLPDIISRLSDPQRGMNEEDFNTIMKQLFSYITKERQTESLVEKLCQRFRTAKTERQWSDLAVSLSLLSMCERGFKRLQECWECYSDKLTEPGVYQPLLSIAAKLRRGAKQQFKVEKCPYVPLFKLLPQIFWSPYEYNSLLFAVDDSDLMTPKQQKHSQRRPRKPITFSSDEEEEGDYAHLCFYLLVQLHNLFGAFYFKQNLLTCLQTYFFLQLPAAMPAGDFL
uniref:Condensin complex subunit 1 n=1 Tax=Denticeps clupeoides TaxID=299321 RepID=A0AAY4AWB2_9TELE